jgi:cobyrinic acid a,c-diamide synthase
MDGLHMCCVFNGGHPEIFKKRLEDLRKKHEKLLAEIRALLE